MPTNSINETIHKLRVLDQQVQEAAQMARAQNMLRVAVLQDDMHETILDAITYLTDVENCRGDFCPRHF